ncbi:MAG: hypothetical protein H7228_11800 [Polaromonas sp.]|nr:hypothetical protein [Polaromonas sp.]
MSGATSLAVVLPASAYTWLAFPAVSAKTRPPAMMTSAGLREAALTRAMVSATRGS